MKFKDLFDRRQRPRVVEDNFVYNDTMSVHELTSMLMTIRGEEMMENDPPKREHLQRQIEELTGLVARKTDRPKREKWSEEKRLAQHRGVGY